MRSTHARGFTLIEVTIAAGILVGIALGTAQLFAVAIHSNMQARRQLAMSLLAAAKIDDLAIAAGARTLRGEGGALDRSIDGFSDTASAAGAVYTRRWTVTTVAARADLVALVVRVTAAGSRDGPGPGAVQIATLCGGGP
jgi:Tfp pilus assembly protein PilV